MPCAAATRFPPIAGAGKGTPIWMKSEERDRIARTVAAIKAVTGTRPVGWHTRSPGGKTVTGFTNGEEEEVGLTNVVPFLVEDELMSLGATFSKVKNWGVHTVADGQLITGQNPASSGPAARLLIDTLNKQAR